MSKVYAVVDSNGVLASLLSIGEARAFLEKTARDRDDMLEDILTCQGFVMEDEEYYSVAGTDHYVRDTGFLSLVTLTYINRSK